MVNYLHRDHLGSVDTITDHTGAVIQRMSFDAWGKRREINWQAMNESAIAAFDTAITTRGFTGHEQLDPVGLIHMNGRVYDAELGRFLSADPHIQALDNLQNFNRYSYVLNNPLSYTDPTGFFFSKLFKAIGKAFGKIFKAIGRALKKLLRSPIIRAIIQIVACSYGAPICALASGAITAASGGSVADVLKAAAFAFIQVKVWNGVSDFLKINGLATNYLVKGLVHGVVGGALSVAQGGNFMQGFVSNAIGAVAGLAASGLDIGAHTAIVAATGCAGAVLSGGKCANGAVTAAFANLFNYWKTTVQRAKKDIVGFVGGGGDARSKIVKGVHDRYKGEKEYFSWRDEGAIGAWIKKFQAKGYKITLIGHSYGADTAMKVVASGVYVNRLVTVDPVGSIDVELLTGGESSGFEGRANLSKVNKYSGFWTNVHSNSSTSDISDIIGGIGQRYGSTPAGFADIHITTERYNHRDVCYAFCAAGVP